MRKEQIVHHKVVTEKAINVTACAEDQGFQIKNLELDAYGDGTGRWQVVVHMEIF